MNVKWRCKKCKQVLVSDTDERHKMDTCRCGKSSIDAEKWYVRVIGSAEFLFDKKKGK